jgi:hypothetical protein
MEPSLATRFSSRSVVLVAGGGAGDDRAVVLDPGDD